MLLQVKLFSPTDFLKKDGKKILKSQYHCCGYVLTPKA